MMSGNDEIIIFRPPEIPGLKEMKIDFSPGSESLRVIHISADDRSALRFGSPGAIKGALLEELVGEDESSRMFADIEDDQGFIRVVDKVNSLFKAAVEAVDEESRPDFIEAKRLGVIRRLLEHIDSPAVLQLSDGKYPSIRLSNDGRFEIPAALAYLLHDRYLNFKFWSSWDEEDTSLRDSSSKWGYVIFR